MRSCGPSFDLFDDTLASRRLRTSTRQPHNMTSRIQPASEEALSLALAHAAYTSGTLRVVETNLSGYTHLVASRQGLFVIDRRRVTRIAYGLFYGITIEAPFVYAFECCDLPRSYTQRGRIVRLTIENERITASSVLANELDNGCHQIDLIDGHLCVLDTYNQRVLRMAVDGTHAEFLHPLPAADGQDWSRGYVHVNSLLEIDDGIALLLHNGGTHTGKPSSVMFCDRDWQPQRLHTLDGAGCHNLALLEDGTLLACGSLNGALISTQGLNIPVSNQMTRGLSVGADEIVVGASTFSSRQNRHTRAGTVSFLKRDYTPELELDVPGAPTDIRRLDGQDYSLSSHVRKRRTNRTTHLSTAR